MSSSQLVYLFVFQVAAEIAAPLSQVKKVTMISMGKSEVGAAKLTTEVLNVMESLPKVVEGLTGVNISKVFVLIFGIDYQLCQFICAQYCIYISQKSLFFKM